LVLIGNGNEVDKGTFEIISNDKTKTQIKKIIWAKIILAGSEFA
jgi:hypothetical protein